MDNDVIPTLIEMVLNDSSDVAKEAAWAVSNFTSGCSREQMQYLVNCDVINTLVSLLDSTDSKIVMVGLEGMTTSHPYTMVDMFIRSGKCDPTNGNGCCAQGIVITLCASQSDIL